MDSTNFTPPARRSMTDAEIHEALGNAQADEAGITAAMELLETQAQLRDIEKMELSAWVLEMERIGSPEALLAVENADRAAKGLAPLDQPTIKQPVVEPIEDAVARLNALYANSAGAPEEPVLVPQEETEEVVEIEEELLSETQETELVSANIDDVDSFERLLAADTVVGAEEEITALEEQLADELLDDAQISPVGFSVVEKDPGVEFVSESQLEALSLESTPKVNRRSRASSQFWAWLALSGSVFPLGLAWYINSIGITFAQGALAIFLGSLASAAVVSIGALAGKRSGLPTVLLSRAAFGVFANAAPGAVLTVARIFWTIAMVATILLLGFDFSGLTPTSFELNSSSTIIGGSVIAVVLAAVVLAVFGGIVLFRSQQLAGILGLLTLIVLIALKISSIDFGKLNESEPSSWQDTFAVAVLTFCIFGLVWTSAGADFARKLAITARGASVVGWGALSLALVPALVGAFGLALFSTVNVRSNTLSSAGFYSSTFFQDFSTIYEPMLGYLALGSALVSSIVVLAMSLYSTNLSLHSIGAKLPPLLAQPLLGVLGLVGASAVVYFITDAWGLLSDLAIFIAVPVAAWSGIFVSDILIRRIAYHEISLSRGYGFYKSVNWVNLSGWAVATAIGYGLIYLDRDGFTWLGYLADFTVNKQFWATTSLGVVLAFAIGSLLPVLAGIPRIKRQEAEVLAIEARRDDLKEIFGLAD
jgi:purine-cytosine permease-like protein